MGYLPLLLEWLQWAYNFILLYYIKTFDFNLPL
jgi:hypothetical protein